MTSRDGYLKIAKNDDFIKCQSFAVYENDDFNMKVEIWKK